MAPGLQFGSPSMRAGRWRSSRAYGRAGPPCAKVKEGPTTNDLFAFLTTEPNAEVKAIHPKAMPVILTTQGEVETWLTVPTMDALALQRPLPDGALRIVARGDRTGDAPKESPSI
jgi:putative SOS response-associated peptidase YedK